MAGELYLGIMSGTSLDGIDLALATIEKGSAKLIDSHFVAMPEKLASDLKELHANHTITLSKLGELDHRLGKLYAESVIALLEKTSFSAKDIVAIGCHGQTIYHQPEGKNPFTMQIGDANIIAARTGIQTVADFRRKDMAFNGQGAPLVPAFHQAVFQQSHSSLVILNIGGIANVSVIQPDGSVTGFDTGPGNGLLDEWCECHTGKPFDENARFAKQGETNTALLTLLLSDNYFSKPFPKSTGREYFNLSWLKKCLQIYGEPIQKEDVQRTLVELTVQTIHQSVKPLGQGKAPTLIVCGGGVHNPLIINGLTNKLPDWTITTTKAYGINEDDMEAMAFAWLAYRRIHHLPANLPSVTGAQKATTLGCVYLPD
ncbi:anhydro-N-acetylmuramic acid kinase [Vibrio salinus]|uniref:anhydro-N-acetylmuramic acid kinase n=1 Tax=Vibrio salinus TaxID=2899784 RepID=UPI001E5C896E|nr:anhydro-N-acetylmuramic acid kinase [Vibrio salinus]MCE0493226.1 anhydro-N-acetylmuramic acid kinase [Vibrio salinus]